MEEYKGTTSRNQLELALGAQINALISASHALNVSVFLDGIMNSLTNSPSYLDTLTD